MSAEVLETMKVLREILDPTDDFMAIASAEEQMALVDARRERELDEVHAQLRVISRTLEAARSSCMRPPTVASEEAHAKSLHDHDKLRFSLAKSINDAEGLLAGKEAELARLKDECGSLEAKDPEREHQLDGTALRIAIFRGLGFDPVVEKNGEIRKFLIRSQSGEVHCVELDKGHPPTVDQMWKYSS